MPAEPVVIDGSPKVRLVAEKVKGPPAAPVVIFCTATVGPLTALVKVQVISAPAKTLVAGMVNTLPASVPKVPTLPVMTAFASVQLAENAVKAAAGVSVI